MLLSLVRNLSDAPVRGVVNLLRKLTILIRKLQIRQFRSRAERGLRAVRMLVRKPQISPRLLRVAGHDTSSTARTEFSLYSLVANAHRATQSLGVTLPPQASGCALNPA